MYTTVSNQGPFYFHPTTHNSFHCAQYISLLNTYNACVLQIQCPIYPIRAIFDLSCCNYASITRLYLWHCTGRKDYNRVYFNVGNVSLLRSALKLSNNNTTLRSGRLLTCSSNVCSYLEHKCEVIHAFSWNNDEIKGVHLTASWKGMASSCD